MKNPKLCEFPKMHRLISECCSFAYGYDIETCLQHLKDYKIDLGSLVEANSYVLDFCLIAPHEKDIFCKKTTLSFGDYDSITLFVDDSGCIEYVLPFDDAETGLCDLFREEYKSITENLPYFPKQSTEQNFSDVYLWFHKQSVKLIEMDFMTIENSVKSR